MMTWSGFSFIHYSNARKKGQFLHFLLKITEKEGKTDLAHRVGCAVIKSIVPTLIHNSNATVRLLVSLLHRIRCLNQRVCDRKVVHGARQAAPATALNIEQDPIVTVKLRSVHCRLHPLVDLRLVGPVHCEPRARAGVDRGGGVHSVHHLHAVRVRLAEEAVKLRGLAGRLAAEIGDHRELAPVVLPPL
jgi:hypothetical protein